MIRRSPRPVVRVRATLLRGGLGLVAATTLLGVGPADAQAPASGLGGYQGSAQATGMRVFYNPEGLLPTAAILELGVPDALATIASGPSTFARASAADPGDLLANPDALIQQSGQAPGTVPAYPYRIEARSGIGEPTSELSPAPGLDARVSADATGSRALSTMPSASVPAAVAIGSLSSTSTTTTDGATVSVHARSESSGIDVVGMLAIDSVVTDLMIVSDGTTTTVTGGTVVTGATAMGQPVTIDGEGIQGGPAAFNQAFEALGIRITVAAPVQQGEGTSGQLTSTGLRIDFEASDESVPGVTDVIDGLPDLPTPIPGAPSPGDLIAVVKANEVTSIGLGGATVTLTARAPVARTPITPAAPASPSAPAASSPAASSTPVPVPRSAVASPPAAPTLATANPIGTSSTPSPASTPAGLAQGIGALAVLALLAQPFLGNKLSKVASTLTDDGPAESCPREGA